MPGIIPRRETRLAYPLFVRVLIPVLLGAALAAAGEEWRSARGNLQNTGVVKNRGPVAKPRVVWERKEKETISRGVALAAGKLVYGAGEYVVACRRQSDGDELWNAAVKQQVSAWPAIANDRVYVGSPDRVHHIIAFDNGKDLGGVVAEAAVLADPAVVGGHHVEVAVEGPGEFQGAFVKTVMQRRGIIVGTTEEQDFVRVEADVPLAEMFGYSTDLRSATQGKAEYTMEFIRYDQVPAEVSEKLKKEFKQGAEVGG